MIESLLTAASALPKRPGHAALESLAEQLRALVPALDPDDLDAVRTGDPRRILARHRDGPVIALRWYEPGYVSTVHSHAWTILVGLEGSGTLERFELVGGRARSVANAPTDAPNVALIDGDEIHRQHAGPQGALELVLIGDYDPEARPQTEYET
jgi:hypothetical protein